MSSLGMVLNIASSALAAQKYAMDVTAQNIANVNTEGYSRQIPNLQAKQAIQYQGVILGLGVKTEQVTRSVDQFIENRLMQEKSNLSSSQEMEKYMQVLESIFSENSETSISSMLSDYWNLWNDVSNNPSGAVERTALYEHSVLISEQFKSLSPNLSQIQTDITNAVTTGVDRINKITSEIAQINVEIVGMEGNNNVANDLRDKRNVLVSELNEYLDIKTFEQDNHSLTIIAGRGCTLVQEDRNYELEMRGSKGDRVKWQDSGGNYVDITNYITNGKLGGWLDLRDNIISKYELDLDAMAKEFIWSVNQQHSQGVGLKLFESGSTITGSYQTDTDLGELEYGSEIQFIANGFNLWIEDRTDPANPTIDYVSVDLSGLNSSSSLSDLATAINNQITGAGLTGITVDGSGSALSLIAGNNYAFGFSDENSNILAALGVNTFFTGTGAGSIGLNAMLNDKDYIAAAQIDTDGSYATGDNTNALAMTDLQYTSMDISRWTCDRLNENTEGTVTMTIEDYYHSMVASIGIVSSSISRETEFNEMMVNELNTLRNSVSAVSLDEEMTNIIKYQHAFQAAAKLITISDEMLNTLISAR